MSTLMFISVTLGPAIAKAIMKSWVKDTPILDNLLPDLIDILKANIVNENERRNAAYEIEKLGEKIALSLKPYLDNSSELKSLNSDQRDVVVSELAETLKQAKLSAEMVVNFELRQERLERYLIKIRPIRSDDLDEAQESLYNLMIVHASHEIIAAVTELSSYERHFGAKVLEKLTLILQYFEVPNQILAELERKYLESFSVRFDRTENIGQPQLTPSVRHQRLRDAYVPLNVEVVSVASKSPDDTPHFLSQLLMIGRSNRDIDLEQLLVSSRRLIVYGDAGSGKSTLLQWIGVCVAKQEFSQSLENWNRCIPFFISLRGQPDYDIAAGLPLPEHFTTISTPQIAGAMPSGWVHSQLLSGRALVLIDGIDELSDGQRHITLERLNGLISNFPNARYIISSRSTMFGRSKWPDWHNWTEIENFISVKLLPMTPDKVYTFVERWHNALAQIVSDENDKAELPGLSRNLQVLLQDRLSVQQLATTPLLCAMICALHREHRQNLPNERNTLYRECIRMLIGRDVGRSIVTEHHFPELSDSRKLVLLQSVAYWMMRNDKVVASEIEIDERFAEKLIMLNLSRPLTGSEVRKYFVARTGLLKSEENQIEFTHVTFKVFLAAQQAIDDGDITFLTKNVLNEQWRDMIVLAAGLANHRDSIRLITGLLERGKRLKKNPGRQRIFDVLMDCLENCIVLPPEFRERIHKEAQALKIQVDNNAENRKIHTN